MFTFFREAQIHTEEDLEKLNAVFTSGDAPARACRRLCYMFRSLSSLTQTFSTPCDDLYFILTPNTESSIC